MGILWWFVFNHNPLNSATWACAWKRQLVQGNVDSCGAGRRTRCWRRMLLHCASLSWTNYSGDKCDTPRALNRGLNSIEWLKVSVWCDFRLAWIPTMKSCWSTYSSVCCEITCCLETSVTWCMRAALPRSLNAKNPLQCHIKPNLNISIFSVYTAYVIM